jgi:hypothetical protein
MIRRKSKTVHVVHESRLPEDPTFYEHDWDRLVCFDERFKSFLSRVYPPDMISLIPFPCAPWREGDKEKARKQLGLTLDSKIILVFGQKWRHLGQEETEALRRLQSEFKVLVVIGSES